MLEFNVLLIKVKVILINYFSLFCRMLWGIALVCILYAPFMVFLRKPPEKEEKQVI